MKPEQYYVDECDPRVVEYIQQLEATNKQLIEALVEVQDSHVMSDGLTLISDQTKAKIKTALRDAGV